MCAYVYIIGIIHFIIHYAYYKAFNAWWCFFWRITDLLVTSSDLLWTATQRMMKFNEPFWNVLWFRGWGNGFEVKSTRCYSRGPEVCPMQLLSSCQTAQKCLWLQLQGTQYLLLVSEHTYTQVAYTHIFECGYTCTHTCACTHTHKLNL